MFVPDILRKWSLACFKAPSIRLVCISTSFLVLSILIDVHFLEGVLVKYSKMVVPQLVQSTIGTPTIAVYSEPCFNVPLNDGYEGVLRPVRDGIYEEGVRVPLHHSKNPNL